MALFQIYFLHPDLKTARRDTAIGGAMLMVSGLLSMAVAMKCIVSLHADLMSRRTVAGST